MANENAVPKRIESDIGMLKFMLRALYGRDCDGLADALIARFGSFNGIFRATHEELVAVRGITDRVASFFTFAKPAFRQALMRSAEGVRIDSESALVRYAMTFFMNAQSPCDYCLYLDAKDKIIRAERLTEADRVRETVGGACRYRAEKTALIYCDPAAAVPSPSARRLERLTDIIKALDILGIGFVDCIEYRPFKFFGLRRAAGGDARVVEAAESSFVRYADSRVSVSRMLEYIRSRSK